MHRNRRVIIPLTILAVSALILLTLFQNCAEKNFQPISLTSTADSQANGDPEDSEPSAPVVPEIPSQTPDPAPTPDPSSTPDPNPPVATPIPVPEPTPSPTPNLPSVYSRVNRLVVTTADDRPSGIIQTQDLGYLTGGRSMNGTNDGTITKWNALGDRVWTTIVKGTATLGDDNDQVFDVVEVSDGYIAAGLLKSFQRSVSPSRYEEILLTKVNKDTGQIVWTRQIGTLGRDLALDIDLYNDPVSGPSLILVGDPGLITKLDINGNVVWARSLSNSRFNGVAHIPGIGFAAAGGPLFATFNYSGQPLALKSVSGANFYGIDLGSDGHLYVGGYTSQNQGIIMKATTDGNITQQMIYTGGSFNIHALAPMRSGGVVASANTSYSGSSRLEVGIAKIRADLSVDFAKVFGGPGNDTVYWNTITQRADGGLAIISGFDSGNGTTAISSDQTLLLTDQYGNLSATCSDIQKPLSITATPGNLSVTNQVLTSLVAIQLANRSVNLPIVSYTSTEMNVCR